MSIHQVMRLHPEEGLQDGSSRSSEKDVEGNDVDDHDDDDDDDNEGVLEAVLNKILHARLLFPDCDHLSVSTS